MVCVEQILLNSQVHEFIIEYINSDKCRSHEEVDLIMCRVNFRSGWLDLYYPKI